MKKIFKIIIYVITAILIAGINFVSYLVLTEYQPADVENLTVKGTRKDIVQLNKDYVALDWNIGFFGMDKDVDFFMDGGKMVFPINKEHVEKAMEGASSLIKNSGANVVFLQEVDENSKRTYGINEVEYLDKYLGVNSIFAYNFKVNYIPYPLPPLGKMNSGIYTATNYNITDSKRYSLPVPFEFPERLANLKRAFSVTYSNIENSNKQLVLINAHLDAYDKDNKGKIAQTKQLLEFMKMEYDKGNYVLLGADFNQQLNASLKQQIPSELWQAEDFDFSLIPENFKVYTGNSYSARLNNKPYEKNSEGTYQFVIDGFIASDNIEIKEVETIDTQYEFSDHNPVKLKFMLK